MGLGGKLRELDIPPFPWGQTRPCGLQQAAGCTPSYTYGCPLFGDLDGDDDADVVDIMHLPGSWQLPGR